MLVNPLTALGMVETMRMEGHSALAPRRARTWVDAPEDLPQRRRELVNIVRSPEHVNLLRAVGAKQVVVSSVPTFMDDLTAAFVATGATLAFDAVGGGKLASQILSCMEAAANRTAKEYSRYGSTKHKQVYVYGGRIAARPS
jgi:NADPH2:quinone reductase